MTGTRTWSRRACAALAIGAMALLAAGCGGSNDPGPLSATGVDGLSSDGQKQAYVDGVARALQQLGSAQGEGFARSVQGGNKKQLQTAALAWRQGGEQLKGLDPPKDAVEAHQALVAAVDGLATWNDRIVQAAPNKARTRALFKQAAASQPSTAFGESICGLVDAGYEVLADANACSPLDDASAPTG